jgi:hypothetical protein
MKAYHIGNAQVLLGLIGYNYLLCLNFVMADSDSCRRIKRPTMFSTEAVPSVFQTSALLIISPERLGPQHLGECVGYLSLTENLGWPADAMRRDVLFNRVENR